MCVNQSLKTGFAILVGAGWLFNLVAPVFLSNYHNSLAVNAPMLLVLGALWSTGKKGSDDE